MTTSAQERNYAVAQSVLFCLFAVAVIFGPGPVLFVSELSGIVGNILCGAGLALMFLAIVALRKVIQVEPEPKAGGRLITTGLYRWFRHPIYSGIVVIIVGMFLRRPTALVADRGGRHHRVPGRENQATRRAFFSSATRTTRSTGSAPWA